MKENAMNSFGSGVSIIHNIKNDYGDLVARITRRSPLIGKVREDLGKISYSLPGYSIPGPNASEHVNYITEVTPLKLKVVEIGVTMGSQTWERTYRLDSKEVAGEDIFITYFDKVISYKVGDEIEIHKLKMTLTHHLVVKNTEHGEHPVSIMHGTVRNVGMENKRFDFNYSVISKFSTIVDITLTPERMQYDGGGNKIRTSVAVGEQGFVLTLLDRSDVGMLRLKQVEFIEEIIDLQLWVIADMKTIEQFKNRAWYLNIT